MSKTTMRRVRFGRNAFEPATGRLWAGTAEVRLTRRSAAVLALLIERAGHPVSKADLFALVWRNTVVGDDALTTCIQELRRVLGDDAKQPRYIETRHRYGYSFVAPLTNGASAPEQAAIAVLPFTDMSPQRDQGYFCEGVAEELIDALNRVDGLRVACRSCSFRFRDAGVDVRAVGRELAVSAVVQGSVRKSGDRLRITVQLVNAASGYHEWSRRFEHPLGDVFAVQDEIAATVARSVRGGALSTAIFPRADPPPPIADIRLPIAAPRTLDSSALLPPRTRGRSTVPDNTRRPPASLAVC
jgi:adenylate cyclase